MNDMAGLQRCRKMSTELWLCRFQHVPVSYSGALRTLPSQKALYGSMLPRESAILYGSILTRGSLQSCCGHQREQRHAP